MKTKLRTKREYHAFDVAVMTFVVALDRLIFTKGKGFWRNIWTPQTIRGGGFDISLKENIPAMENEYFLIITPVSWKNKNSYIFLRVMSMGKTWYIVEGSVNLEGFKKDIPSDIHGFPFSCEEVMACMYDMKIVSCDGSFSHFFNL